MQNNMGTILGIKGHATRSKEVIELLQMIGGEAIAAKGDDEKAIYVIPNNGIIDIRYTYEKRIDNYAIFTLEEFLEKFPYTVGDKVHIYVQNNDIDGRCDIEVAEITSMRWNPTICQIAYKMKNINREFYKEEIKCKVADSNKQTRVMGKKLAIVGHATRGREVIRLLKMLGGNEGLSDTGLRLGGTEVCCVYHIGTGGSIIYSHHSAVNDDFIVFTLEEFQKKYPFEVGDKVVYTKFGDNCNDYPVTIESMKWTGTTIEYTFNDCVTCLTKDLKMWEEEPKAVIAGICLNSCDYADEVELNLGDYEIEVRGNRTYAVKKKSKYPETFEECLNLLYCKSILRPIIGHKAELLLNLEKLLICRDAYWKIASEQMGLDKPWEHDWTSGKPVYCISVSVNTIGTGKWYTDNKILAFPTEEMRDVFYKNFKDLIESCKELL